MQAYCVVCAWRLDQINWKEDAKDNLRMIAWVILGILQIGGLVLLFTTPLYGISITMIVVSAIGCWFMNS